MILTREEKVILSVIIISLIFGCLIYFFTSYKNKIKKEKIVSKPVYLNINTATLDELEKLPGVGKIIAQRILDYRKNNKGIKRIEELKNIKGISNKKFEKIKKYIRTE